ncbi:hypothetical protein NDU88_005159 [Pleurodeles waltl]|uniref:Uncharacterized protein n=1 Tax=Pleurodeles waltl TaxID=8319 RepID=A0AAV7LWM9_PLEWA|nr:hypothetical protein NDU88_005159 [Pleurodeles waltl]
MPVSSRCYTVSVRDGRDECDNKRLIRGLRVRIAFSLACALCLNRSVESAQEMGHSMPDESEARREGVPRRGPDVQSGWSLPSAVNE